VWDFRHIEAQAFQDRLSVDRERTTAQLGPGVARFLQNQDTRREFGGNARKMQCRGEASGAATEDEDVLGHNGILTKRARLGAAYGWSTPYGIILQQSPLDRPIHN
jgi:hypothetical protein